MVTILKNWIKRDPIDFIFNIISGTAIAVFFYVFVVFMSVL